MATLKRSPLFPDVACYTDIGYKPTMEISADRGVAVPPGTPEAVMAVLEKAFLNVANNPEVKSAMEKEGFTPVAMGHKESVEHIKKLTREYAEMVKDMQK